MIIFINSRQTVAVGIVALTATSSQRNDVMQRILRGTDRAAAIRIKDTSLKETAATFDREGDVCHQFQCSIRVT